MLKYNIMNCVAVFAMHISLCNFSLNYFVITCSSIFEMHIAILYQYYFALTLFCFSIHCLMSSLAQSLLPIIHKCACFQTCISRMFWFSVPLSFFNCSSYYWLYYLPLVITIPSPPSASLYIHNNLVMTVWTILNSTWQGRLGFTAVPQE
jgi:hypothetical protein